MAAKGVEGLESYPCGCCLGFHLGHARKGFFIIFEWPKRHERTR
jgi:hypothetical protein